jgi:hypothetical protein
MGCTATDRGIIAGLDGLESVDILPSHLSVHRLRNGVANLLIHLLFGGAIRARMQCLGYQRAVQPSMTSSMVQEHFPLYPASVRNPSPLAAQLPVEVSQFIYVDFLLRGSHT